MSDQTQPPAERHATPPANPDTGPQAASPRPLPVGWRIALFLWTTSFAFLFLYEMLTSFFRLLAR